MILISPFRHRLPTAAARRAVCLTMSRTWILLPACSGCCRFMTMNCSRRMGAGPVHRAVWYRKLTNTCRHFISLARILDLSELPMEGLLFACDRPAGWRLGTSSVRHRRFVASACPLAAAAAAAALACRLLPCTCAPRELLLVVIILQSVVCSTGYLSPHFYARSEAREAAPRIEQDDDQNRRQLFAFRCHHYRYWSGSSRPPRGRVNE